MKALTISGTLGFQTKFAGGRDFELVEMKCALKNELANNRSKGVEGKTLIFGKVDDNGPFFFFEGKKWIYIKNALAMGCTKVHMTCTIGTNRQTKRRESMINAHGLKFLSLKTRKYIHGLKLT